MIDNGSIDKICNGWLFSLNLTDSNQKKIKYPN